MPSRVSVLHHFDAKGNHLTTDVWREEAPGSAEANLHAAIKQLAAVEMADIRVKAFEVEVFGEHVGLKRVIDEGIFEYVPYGLVFSAPWDGTYST